MYLLIAALLSKESILKDCKELIAARCLTICPFGLVKTLKTSQTTNLLKALYKTGFFDQIAIDRRGNTLVIKVVERPTIGTITISGNKMIGTKALKKTLKGIGIAQGLVYNESTLDNVKQSLQREYYDRGNYNASVNTVVTPANENRVNIAIKITEGPSATIQQVKIIGNKKFKEKNFTASVQIKEKTFVIIFV